MKCPVQPPDQRAHPVQAANPPNKCPVAGIKIFLVNPLPLITQPVPDNLIAGTGNIVQCLDKIIGISVCRLSRRQPLLVFIAYAQLCPKLEPPAMPKNTAKRHINMALYEPIPRRKDVQRASARAHYSMQFFQHPYLIHHMLKDLFGNNEIERIVFKRKSPPPPQYPQ